MSRHRIRQGGFGGQGGGLRQRQPFGQRRALCRQRRQPFGQCGVFSSESLTCGCGIIGKGGFARRVAVDTGDAGGQCGIAAGQFLRFGVQQGAALAQGLDARRALGVDCLFAPLRGLEQRRTLMASPATDPAMRDAAHAMLGVGGVPVSLIRDSAGFVAQRIVAQIISVGCDIAQQRVASPADIDLGVRLGLGYPMGPLAMGDALGPRRVLGILEQMLAITGDPRCRPSPWLRRRALLGLSLLSAD